LQWEEFIEKFPIQLNKQQTDAVRMVDGAVLLLAVPGSGKTTVLVARLGYMIYCRGIAPEKILTVTYTVAATKDMSARFAGFFGREMAERLEFRTINGICAKIIAFYGRKIGKDAFKLVTDDKSMTGVLAQIYQEVEDTYPAESDLKNVRTMITYIKNRMLKDDEIKEMDANLDIHISGIYKEYCGKLREQGLMDYDDQMIYAYTMLQRSPEVLRYFQNLYPYICVDEAQDTSKIQHAIIALLASKTENLFMVGDEDQSIYGFRAAYPEALLSFEKDHKGAKVLLMEENFRSNANIVAAADGFIQKNTLRHEKHMKPAREAWSRIREIKVKDRMAQYPYLAEIADGCQKQTAVLYRDHESVVPLVDLLERNGAPYRIRNTELTFFTHRTVLDIENIIKLALDPTDTEAFLQIYYKIGTYIRKQDAFKIAEISRRHDIPVLDAAIEFGGLQGHTISSVKSVRTHLKNMLDERGDKAVQRIVRYMGYGDYMERSGIGDGKIFILKAIGVRETSPASLLERIYFLQDIFRNKETDYQCPFILSTIHASKGLEYDTVYLMDVADGLFPEEVLLDRKRASKQEVETYEEERRLFYVGATRAKDNLLLFNTGMESTFRRQLLEKDKAAASVLSAAERKAFSERFRDGALIQHSKYGAGAVSGIDEKRVSICFSKDKKERTFDLEALYQSGQLLNK